MAVVITGGAGFIGSHIVDQFVAAGEEVVVIDNLSSGSKTNLPAKARLVVADIQSEAAAAALKEIKPSVLVHAAAQISVRASMENPLFDTKVNVVGLVNLLSAVKEASLSPHLVLLSTGGAIYGEQEVFPADESHVCKPESVYGLAKRVSELYLDMWQRAFGLSYCALRLSNVYGPRQNPHGEAGVVAIFSKLLLAGKTPTINGSGAQTRDFVFVEDVARAAKIAADKRIHGIFNIGTGKETSVNELYAALAAACGHTLAPRHVPTKAGEQMRSCIDASKAAREIGWKPEIELREGVARTVSWFRAHN